MNIFKSKGLFLSLGVLMSGIGIYAKTTAQIEDEKTEIMRKINSAHIIAFSKDNLFTAVKDYERKMLDVEAEKTRQEQFKKDLNTFLNGELGIWKIVIDESAKYIADNAFKTESIIKALGSSLTANNAITSPLRYYYSSGMEGKPLSEKLSLIKPQIDALKKTKTALENAGTALEEDKLTGFFVKNKTEKQAAHNVLTTLILYLNTTIEKIIKDYNLLAPQQKSKAKPAARTPRPVGPPKLNTGLTAPARPQ
ncbi:MAG: hypothetical protein NT124_01435 [Candidatus Dependentiae bacterium]|nr:hypothetical protein [Candidatus Dependentiae bacterium]